MLAHGSHLVDLARFLAGEIETVEARLRESYGARCWFIDVGFESGAIGHLDLTVAVRMDWHEGFEVQGERGGVLAKTYNPWYYKSSDVEIFHESDATFRRPLAADGHFYRRQVEGFADAVLTGRPARGATAEDGVASVRAMVAIAQSVREGRPVSLGRSHRAGVMRLGIFAKTFPGSDPETVLAGVANAGFGLAQYNMACSGLDPLPDAIPEDVTTAIRAASAAAGVGIAAVSGTFNMIHPDPAVRADGLRRLAVLIAAAPAMGTRLVTLCTGTRDPADMWRAHPDNATPEAWRDLVASMETAVAVAEANGVDLGIEPELANVVSSAEAARRLIDEMQSPRLRIVLDAANLFETASLAEQRDIVTRAVDLLADRIVMAHAKDRAANGDFVAAGQGVLDYPHYLAALRRAGFDGPLVAHGLDGGRGAGRWARSCAAHWPKRGAAA